MTFGRKLRMLRVGKGLTQAEMANKIGISRRAYINYELDKAKPRYKKAYNAMAEILDCDVNELREEKHERTFKYDFDRNASYAWVSNNKVNELYIRAQEQYIRELVLVKNYVFLNEVLDALGMDRTPWGQLYGWKKDYGYVDFGYSEDNKNHKITLNFNCTYILKDFFNEYGEELEFHD